MGTKEMNYEQLLATDGKARRGEPVISSDGVDESCDTCHGQGEVWTGENQSFSYMSMQPAEPIMEACPECNGESASDGRAAFAAYLKDCGKHDIEPDIGGAFNFAWQARAALSAPSHGEQVREPSDKQVELLDPWMRAEAARELLRKVFAAAPSAGSQKEQGE